MRKLKLNLERLDVQTFATTDSLDCQPAAMAYLASSSPCLNSEVTCDPLACMWTA